jgi:AI-2 transport protein TqsA
MIPITDPSTSHPGLRLIMVTAAMVIILWGINQAQGVLVLLLVSMFLAVLGTVPLRWLEHRGIPSVLAVMLVMATMVALLLVIGGVVGASLSSFYDALPAYRTRMQAMVLSLKHLTARHGVLITDAMLMRFVNPDGVLDLTASLFSSLGSVLSNVFLILFTVFFILLERSSFPVKLRSILEQPKAVFPGVTHFVGEIKRYMVIKTLINLVAGVLTTVWLMVLGVDFPVIWGVLAFLFHFVPNVGSIVAAVPAMLLALVQYGPGSAALTAGGYIVIGTIIGNVIEPRIMGRHLGLSTLVVFLSLVFWGSLLGVVGALLCVPLTMTLKLACESRADTQWIAVLLGTEVSHGETDPVLSPKVRM